MMRTGTRRSGVAQAAAGALAVALALAGASARAADDDGEHPRDGERDVLSLDARVSARIVPDIAWVGLAAEQQGTDLAAMTSEVNRLLATGLREARGVPAVTASTGAFSTQPRHDEKGKRTGWVVRGEMQLRSRDTEALGRLAGRLSESLQVSGNGFEISTELRRAEEAKLLEQGLADFQARARASTQALGYKGYVIRQVSVGAVGGAPVAVRSMAMARSRDVGADMPIEAGEATLGLTVSGSVKMTR